MLRTCELFLLKPKDFISIFTFTFTPFENKFRKQLYIRNLVTKQLYTPILSFFVQELHCNSKNPILLLLYIFQTYLEPESNVFLKLREGFDVHFYSYIFFS